MRDDIKSTGRRGNGSTRARANGRICVRGGTTGLGWIRLGREGRVGLELVPFQAEAGRVNDGSYGIRLYESESVNGT